MPLSRETFTAFSDYIQRELGIQMPPKKALMLSGRLSRRVRALGLRDADEYRKHVFSGDGAELVQLIDAVTTNKTDFFREPRQLDVLAQHILPELAREQGHARLWSAGCSTGEEVYTLAMLCAEQARISRGLAWGVLGTDISTRVLDEARRAIYPASSVAPVPPSLRERYLMRGTRGRKGQVRVVPSLRGHASFHRLNFMDAEYPLRDLMDVILFRNVAIYFDRPTQKQVVAKLLRHLAPGGWLIIGQSESLAGMALPVEQVTPAVFRKV